MEIDFPNLFARFEPDSKEYAEEIIDLQTRLLLQDAMKVMKHSRRGVLKGTDIDQAMKMRKAPPLCTFSHLNPDTIYHNPETNKLEVNEEEVLLTNLLHFDLPQCPPEPSLTMHWLAVDGVQPDIAQNPSKHQSLRAKVSAIKVSDATDEEFTKHEIPIELKELFTNITTVLHDCDGINITEEVSAAMMSLQTARGLHELVPYFVHFIAQEVMTNLTKLPKLVLMLNVTSAMDGNPSMRLEPYLHQILPIMLTLVLSDPLCDNVNVDDHWTLRSEAAAFVGNICTRFSKEYVTLRGKMLRTLESAIKDTNKPMTTQFGAVSLLAVLGASAIEEVLFPIVNALVKSLKGVMSGDDYDDNVKMHAQKLYYATMIACAIYVKERNEMSDMNAQIYHPKLVALFGEDLNNHLRMLLGQTMM